MVSFSPESLRSASSLMVIASLVAGAFGLFVMFTGIGKGAVSGDASQIIFGFFSYLLGAVLSLSAAICSHAAKMGSQSDTEPRNHLPLIVFGGYVTSIALYFLVVF